VTIDRLPDVALLEMFDFYQVKDWIEAWYKLVHVCREWRNVVFGSPRRLGLKLFCNARTPVRETLDVWPPLPIVIWVSYDEKWDNDNIIAALEHSDRICEISVSFISGPQWENVLEAMEQPFPALKFLQLACEDKATPALPDSFLGGSAPSLEGLVLDHIPFPGLPKLLLSATYLVHLQLSKIPHSGYISPPVMVACLSVLTRLESLLIEFESPQSRPNRRRPSPQTRTLLPVLSSLWFQGVSEYLEDLVARIDVPLLNDFSITFFHQLIFDTPQLDQFINRRTPKFRAHDEAYMQFSYGRVSLKLPPNIVGELKLWLAILCGQSDWQFSSLAQVCGTSFPQALVPAVERLYIIDEDMSELDWQDDIESSQWLELLYPFTGVKDFHIPGDFAPRIAPVLRELVEERVTELLFPALETLFLKEAHPSAIEHFVAARQLAGHPVSVSRW
jgi:hypothetical protein